MYYKIEQIGHLYQNMKLIITFTSNAQQPNC